MSNSRTPIFTPSPGRLCVVPFEDGISPSGRLIVVRNPNEKPVMGRVSELPPGFRDYMEVGDKDSCWRVSVGDTILFGSNSGLEIKVDGERRIILRESEVLAKVEWQEDAVLVESKSGRPGDCPVCGVGLPNHAVGCTADVYPLSN